VTQCAFRWGIDPNKLSRKESATQQTILWSLQRMFTVQ